MELWSWALTIVGMTGIYFTTQKKILGFIIGVGAQALWVAFAISTAQYGFIFSAIGYGVLNVLGIYRWRKQSKEDNAESSRNS